MKDSEEFSLAKFFGNLEIIRQQIFKSYIANFSGYYHDVRDITSTFSGFIAEIQINPQELLKIKKVYAEFFQKQEELWKRIFLEGPGREKEPLVSPKRGDKRFAAEEWTKYPYFNFLKQNHLLLENLSDAIVSKVELSDRKKKKLKFYFDQYINAASPSNFLFTNPEALNLAIKTQGKSLWNGFNNFVEDLQKGRISQTDESVFEVGKNLAVTAGSVIFENELMQLIQYTPSTIKVNEIPLLIIPPWINKYYILDLKSETSFVKFNVDKGITVFMISWRNPMPGEASVTFDDYANKGALKAIGVVKKISEVNKINVLGYCLGGTLLSIAGAILSIDKKKNPINCATFLAAMIDFSDIGPMGNVISGALVKKLERGELLRDGILHGYEMETAFNLIRANDLIWNYVSNNYLKGIKPPAFDVMYWTNDNTNLPAKMYVYYMRKMILENKLSRKNALRICDIPIDIGKIEFPVYVVALKEDYISPAKTAFVTTELVSGPFQFVLGDSGHVMGIVNPPFKKKYGYYTDGKFGYGFEEWQKTARYVEGSWWTSWNEWLVENSGLKVPAPERAGNEAYTIIEPAPGRYVKQKNIEHFV
jgi:polyhydroxyalkanoate synthase